MAEAVVSQNSELVSNETGVLKQAGTLVTQVKKMYSQPAFQRSLPTIVALVVLMSLRKRNHGQPVVVGR